MGRHPHRGEDLLATLEVCRGVQVAGAGKIDVNVLLDRRRPAAHDQNAAGKLDRLVDVVGGERVVLRSASQIRTRSSRILNHVM